MFNFKKKIVLFYIYVIVFFCLSCQKQNNDTYAENEWDIKSDFTSPFDYNLSRDSDYLSLCNQLFNINYDVKMNKEVIGVDSSGKINIYAYIFEPKEYKYTVYLQAGIHGIEIDPVFALGNFIRNVYTSNSEQFKLLAKKVKFIIVPVVNVWAFNNKPNYPGFKMNYRFSNNYNNVNLNRDFCSVDPQSETRAIKQFIDKIYSEITFGFDFHSTTEERWGSYMLPYPDRVNLTFIENTIAILKNIAKKNSALNDVNYIGNHSNYPDGYQKGKFSAYMVDTYNVPITTIEYPDYYFDKDLGTSTTQKYSLELISEMIYYNIKYLLDNSISNF